MTPEPVHPDFASRLDHVVVLMFENRSFDNLLGYLYQPEEVPAFDGVLGKALTNPIPASAQDLRTGSVQVHPATDLDTPDPDPGEEFPHVNTQLFGTVEPEANRVSEVDDMKPPFNAPPSGQVPSMKGFVSDYIDYFQVEMGRAPTYNEYAQIMACYSPYQLPVVSQLAKGFAVFDHWFCEVPTQTYPNRSFFHAASSSGFVLNGPPGKFESRNDAPTIFERLQQAGRSWQVYFDPLQFVPATALIHARRLAPYFDTNFSIMDEFYEHAREGTLPNYAFIEPNMLHPHTDMHPPGASKLRQELGLPKPNSMIGGEHLLASVYDSIRSSDSPSGSNWSNSMLLVTFDEHGGTYDHVPPPSAPPPDPAAPEGEMGFRFDRSGVRIPAIAISAWVDPRTVVNQEYRSTSIIRTLRERWSLGPPLTQRDAIAADIAPVLSRSSPRPPNEWPDIHRPPLRRLAELLLDVERPLSKLEKALVGEAMLFSSRAENETLKREVSTMSRSEAHTELLRIQAKYFPRIAKRRSGR